MNICTFIFRNPNPECPMKTSLLSLSFIFSTIIAFAQVPAEWFIDEVNPGQDVRLFEDGERFTEGTKSCHMQLQSGAVPYLVSENFPVTQGKSYSFSIDVFDHDTTGQLKVYCDFYDASGNNVLGEDPVFSTDKEGWQTLGWSATVPPDAVVGYVLVKFYCQPGLTTFIRQADIWVDHCAFIPEGGANSILNGGFEDWTVGIDKVEAISGDFTFYPNPAGERIKIQSEKEGGTVQICDLSGRLILERKMSGKQMDIDVSTLTTGTYIVRFIQGNTLCESLKLIKN